MSSLILGAKHYDFIILPCNNISINERIIYSSSLVMNYATYLVLGFLLVARLIHKVWSAGRAAIYSSRMNLPTAFDLINDRSRMAKEFAGHVCGRCRATDTNSKMRNEYLLQSRSKETGRVARGKEQIQGTEIRTMCCFKAGEIYPPPYEIYPPFEIYPPRLS